jgi:hypothetical protein
MRFAGAWAEHERRAGALVPSPQSLRGRDGQPPPGWAKEAAGHPPEVVGSLVLLLMRRQLRGGDWWTLGPLAPLLRRTFEVPFEHAAVAVALALDVRDGYRFGTAARIATAMLERAAGPDARAGVIPLARELLAGVERSWSQMDAAGRGTVRNRLRALLPDPAELDLDQFLPAADGWAVALKGDLAEAPDQALTARVLGHLAGAGGSRPSKAWERGWAALAGEPGAEAIVRLLLERLADAPPVPVTNDWYSGLPLVLDDRNAEPARGAAWAAATIDASWTVPALKAVVARRLRSDRATPWVAGEKVPFACVLSLGRIGTTEAVAALQALKDATRDKGLRTRIDSALATAAAALGLTPGQLVERAVPDLGLDADGGVEAAGARLTVGDDLKVKVIWDGATRPPPDADPAAVAAAKRRAKELRDAVAAERRRVESLLATGRAWPVADWRRWYLDHPVTGRISSGLLWRVEADGRVLTGLVTRDGVVRTLDGDHPLPGGGTVAMWHPATAPTDEVAAWRARLLADGVIQPLRQAWREVYLLTPAERETATYSNRFAAHVLRYQQLYALTKERGWVTNYLGPWDGGYEGEARRELPDTGLVVVFEHRQLDAGDPYTVEVCGTDRVWFHRAGDRGMGPVPLEEVPPLVLSEAMRDVDLFVGVTSIALDPEWIDRGLGYERYWREASTADLSATARTRRDALALVLPKLKVADRLELGDRHLRVRGRLGAYRIHLGSANVQMEPDDRYLCIIGAPARRVALPFEGDAVLSLIISKALLLAADDRITDASILAQMGRRG